MFKIVGEYGWGRAGKFCDLWPYQVKAKTPDLFYYPARLQDGVIRCMLAGLVLGIIATVPSVAVLVFADSPLAQWRPSVGPADKQCADHLYLMITLSGWPACVAKEAIPVMEERGWSIFYEPKPTLAKATLIRDTIPVLEEIHYWSWYDVKFPPFAHEFDVDEASSAVVSFVQPPQEVYWAYAGKELPDWLDPSVPVLTNIDQGLDPDDEAFWPQYAMEFWHVSNILASFELSYNYTYVIPNEYYGIKDYDNPLYQCSREQCEGQYLEIQTSRSTGLLNEEAELILQATDTLSIPERHYNVYRIPLPFDNTKPMQLMLEFFVSRPTHQGYESDYEIGTIYPRVHDTGDAMYYYTYLESGHTVYDPTLGSRTVDQAWFTAINPSGAIIEEIDSEKTQTEEIVQALLDYAHDRVPIPLEIIPKPPLEPTGPIDGVAPEYYPYLAAKLQENYPDGDYEQLLQESNVKQEWIDTFLDAMPQLG